MFPDLMPAAFTTDDQKFIQTYLQEKILVVQEPDLTASDRCLVFLPELNERIADRLGRFTGYRQWERSV